MMEVTFYDREQETKEIMDTMGMKPRLITFIYGPINSGKTELITHLIEQLPADYVVFYINLRTKFLASYDDFIESLFEMEMGTDGAMTKGKETLAELVSGVTKVAGIPITKEFIDYVFKDNKPKNAFSYMLKLFEEVKKSGKQPVLILDELQKIGDVNVNGSMIYELFNFFIDLTKEKHLTHVFVATSDSLFIERVYSEAMLSGRSRHILVDDFDYATTMDFLDKYGFSYEEKELAWDYCGGKPVYLVELINTRINGESIEEKVHKMFEARKSQIRIVINELRLIGDELEYKGKKIEIAEERVIDALDSFSNTEHRSYEMLNIEEIYLVKRNILFVDAVRGVLKPQSKLDLLAMREVMRNT